MSEILIIEKNMCIISLEEYNELRDFKKTIEENNVYYTSPFFPTRIISVDEAVKEITLFARECKEREDKKSREEYDLNTKYCELLDKKGVQLILKFSNFIKRFKK